MTVLPTPGEAYRFSMAIGAENRGNEGISGSPDSRGMIVRSDKSETKLYARRNFVGELSK